MEWKEDKHGAEPHLLVQGATAVVDINIEAGLVNLLLNLHNRNTTQSILFQYILTYFMHAYIHTYIHTHTYKIFQHIHTYIAYVHM